MVSAFEMLSLMLATALKFSFDMSVRSIRALAIPVWINLVCDLSVLLEAGGWKYQGQSVRKWLAYHQHIAELHLILISIVTTCRSVRVVLNGFLISCEVMSIKLFWALLVSSASCSLLACKFSAHLILDMSVMPIDFKSALGYWTMIDVGYRHTAHDSLEFAVRELRLASCYYPGSECFPCHVVEPWLI